jgi:hypothetical protein
LQAVETCWESGGRPWGEEVGVGVEDSGGLVRVTGRVDGVQNAGGRVGEQEGRVGRDAFGARAGSGCWVEDGQAIHGDFGDARDAGLRRAGVVGRRGGPVLQIDRPDAPGAVDGKAVAGSDLAGVEGEDVVFVLVDFQGRVDVGARWEGTDERRLLCDGIDCPDLAGVVAGD